MAHTPSRPSSLVSSTSGSDANTPQICNKFGSGRWRNSNTHSGIRFRICLCGKFDVGKTSLFRRLQGKEFMEEKPYGELSQFDYHDKNDPCIEVNSICLYFYLICLYLNLTSFFLVSSSFFKLFLFPICKRLCTEKRG